MAKGNKSSSNRSGKSPSVNTGRKSFTPGTPTTGGSRPVQSGSMNSASAGFGGAGRFIPGTPTPRAGSVKTGRGSMNPTKAATRAPTAAIAQPLHQGSAPIGNGTDQGLNSKKAPRANIGVPQWPKGS